MFRIYWSGPRQYKPLVVFIDLSGPKHEYVFSVNIISLANLKA